MTTATAHPAPPSPPALNLAAFLDRALVPLGEKLLAGDRLDFADGMALWETRDLFALAHLADIPRRRLHANRAYYNVNRHINYTNICALSCQFCEFHRKRGEAGAYEYSLEDIFRLAGEAAAAGATEVHIVGGLHPWLPFEWYLEMLRGLRTRFPALHLKAFTAIEINHFSRLAHLSIDEVLTALREAGLGSLPGGGAEVFDDRVHDAVFKGKLRADGWLDIHRRAHRLGLATNATILYGHVESRAERTRHLLALRALQDESLARAPDANHRGTEGTEDAQRDVKEGAKNPVHPVPPCSVSSERGAIENCKLKIENPPAPAFQCIIPLSFIPDGSQLAHLPGPTGLEDLKMLAISRLLLDNVPHVKAFWIMQSPQLSQVSLNWGVDDLDGTVVWYDITKRESQSARRTHQEMTVPDLRRLIREAGFTPIERDTLYRPVIRDPQDWTRWRVMDENNADGCGAASAAPQGQVKN